MTINKAQGQTLNIVGIYLPQPVFSHGQLYVALSRATTSTKLKLLLHTNLLTKQNRTKNIVYTQILRETEDDKFTGCYILQSEREFVLI